MNTELVPHGLNHELLMALANAWSEGHSAARSYYSGGPHAENPYWQAAWEEAR